MISIFLVILTLLLSAFFSGSEIAYLSANKLNIEVFKGKKTSQGNALNDLYSDPKSFLSSMLVGNNIVLVVYTIFCSALVNPILNEYLPLAPVFISFISTIIITIVILIFGEYIPKTIFGMFANEIIYKLALPLKAVMWVLKVPAVALTSLSNMIIKLIFGNIEVVDPVDITRIDLEHYIHSTSNDDREIDKEILNNALNLNQLKVRDCMIPRKEIVFVDKNDNIQELKDAFIESKHSRIIIVDGDVENIIGYVHHQLLFKNSNTFKKNIMDIEFIPDVMNAQDMMYKFMRTNTNIAVVVDEFGGTSGIITLEDILEEIFGEIDDEHDVEDFVETQISENEYIFSGRLEIDYLNNKFENLHLPEGEYMTLSGYIVMTAGSIPSKGDVIDLENFKFIIESKSDTKIETVRVIKLNDHSDNNMSSSQ